MLNKAIGKITKEIQSLDGRISQSMKIQTSVDYIQTLRNKRKGLEQALTLITEEEEENNTPEQNINFASSIIDFKLKEPEILVDKFISFINDTHILTNYHHDYSNEEMLGIIKFLTPLFTSDDNVRIVNKRYNTSLGKRLREALIDLENQRDKELFHLLMNAKEGNNDNYISFLEKKIGSKEELKSNN